MTTLRKIHDEMHSYNRATAPGSECNAWQDFVVDSDDRLGMSPWDDKGFETETPEDFAAY